MSLKDLAPTVFVASIGTLLGMFLTWTHFRSADAVALSQNVAATQQTFIKDFNEKVVPTIQREIEAAKVAAQAATAARVAKK